MLWPNNLVIIAARIRNGPNGIWVLRCALPVTIKGRAYKVPPTDDKNKSSTLLSGPPTIMPSTAPNLTSPPPIHLPLDNWNKR